MTELQIFAVDMVDVLNRRLARMEAIQEAILPMAEEGRDREKIGTLADLAEDEAHRAQAELVKWFDRLTGHRQ
jgi:hypothetical protein